MQRQPSDGPVVIVTGGTRGVGRGIAAGFVDAGARVVVCGRTPPADGDHPHFIECDVREPAAVAAMVDQVVERHGALDVLVNNAGGSPAFEAATASPRLHEGLIRLNLVAPLHCAQAAWRVMNSQPTGGSIINIASISGTRPSPGTAAYGAAKAGLINLTQSLAVEWAPRVRVNAVVPGIVRTEQAEVHYGDAAGQARVAATIPMQRFLEPSDIAAACRYLASADAAMVTGASLVVHGGGERPAFLGAVVEDSGS